jgi:membrane-bound metal-dependent hydrolase YbcI (DUF457 family)
MALCLAHATAGYLAYEALRPPGPHRLDLLAGAVVLANAPDLDFVPGLLLGRPDAFHRGVTHTLGAAVLVTLATWAIARWRRAERPGWWAAFAAAAYGSHLLVDWVTVDAVPPVGIQMLWPLSASWLHAPFNLLGEVIIDRSGRAAFVRSLLTPTALLAWAHEVGMAVVAVASVHVVRAIRAALAAPVADESLEP